MKKIQVIIILFIGMLANINAQDISMKKPTIDNPAFKAELDRLLKYSVPLISVEELNNNSDNYKIYDTREIEEYNASHIPGANHVGYKKFDKSQFENMNRETPIVFYCSVGYRSEKTGNKLQKMGFKKVYNLYGSIFEWANKGYPMENNNHEKTNKIHTYNEQWSQWVNNPKLTKIW